jgi:hypothetical protein
MHPYLDQVQAAQREEEIVRYLRRRPPAPRHERLTRRAVRRSSGR